MVTLLHTNDLHGRVVDGASQPGESLARVGTLIESARSGAPDALLLDAGDTISGQPNCLVTGGRAILAAMEALGYDAMTVGNHEFDQGAEVARAAFADAAFPILSANLIDGADGGPWANVRPYVVLESGGVRVGVFGLTTVNTMLYQYPGWMGPVQVTEPTAAARRVVQTLREDEGVDLVVALTHPGPERRPEAGRAGHRHRRDPRRALAHAAG